jgi:hypothetical protein
MFVASDDKSLTMASRKFAGRLVASRLARDLVVELNLARSDLAWDNDLSPQPCTLRSAVVSHRNGVQTNPK